jgi:hypothetical protein
MNLAAALSDRARAKTLLAAGLSLAVVSGVYADWSMDQQQGWRWCLEDPRARDGSALVFPLWKVTAIDGPDQYRISKVVTGIPVRGDASVLVVGDTVSVVARFDAASSTAVEQSRELHPLRRWKEGLGVVGFLLVAALAPLAFRVVRTPAGRFVEERWRT